MKKRRNLSTEERALWDSVANQAEPMWPKVTPTKPDLNKPVKKAPALDPRPKISPFQIGEKSRKSGSSLPQTPAHKQPLRMDANAYAKMTRGKKTPERKIDLHGMTISQAHPALIRFLMDAFADGKRLVLVITGKGSRQDPQGPFQVQRGVLKRQVPIWLNAPPLNGIILQTAFAHKRHGGEGALYVYLRRQG